MAVSAAFNCARQHMTFWKSGPPYVCTHIRAVEGRHGRCPPVAHWMATTSAVRFCHTAVWLQRPRIAHRALSACWPMCFRCGSKNIKLAQNGAILVRVVLLAGALLATPSRHPCSSFSLSAGDAEAPLVGVSAPHAPCAHGISGGATFPRGRQRLALFGNFQVKVANCEPN